MSEWAKKHAPVDLACANRVESDPQPRTLNPPSTPRTCMHAHTHTHAHMQTHTHFAHGGLNTYLRGCDCDNMQYLPLWNTSYPQ